MKVADEGRPARPRPLAEPSSAAGLQSLVDRFRNEARERTVVGVLPVEVPFPEFGPSIFLAAELTAEARSPVVDLAVRKVQD